MNPDDDVPGEDPVWAVVAIVAGTLLLACAIVGVAVWMVLPEP